MRQKTHQKNTQKKRSIPAIDVTLLCVVVLLFTLGIVMVTSSSIAVADRNFGQPFYYTIRQSLYLCFGGCVALCLQMVPIAFWRKFSGVFMIVTLLALASVFVPGLGKVVNGSARWFNFMGYTFQISELAKLSVVIYLASYMVRHREDLTSNLSGLVRPMVVLGLVSILLLLEPDFGATVVILGTAFCMMFLGGVPLRLFMGALFLVGITLGGLAIAAPYRLQRLTAFLDPWADQFDSGYQLTQALIAFGRGEWLGVGLGSSVQKLFYLPEAHTDFVFAVMAEELGLLGAFGLVLLFIILFARGIKIGINAEKVNDKFAAYLSYGITLWIGLQALINMGVNTGILPTKGLTLPFMSYGGSSIMMVCIAMGILFKVDYVTRKKLRYVRA